MKPKSIVIKWPNGTFTHTRPGEDWIKEAEKAGVSIPTGCLGGSCGACEIEVNGELIRACISKIKPSMSNLLEVEFYADPYW